MLGLLPYRLVSRVGPGMLHNCRRGAGDFRHALGVVLVYAVWSFPAIFQRVPGKLSNVIDIVNVLGVCL